MERERERGRERERERERERRRKISTTKHVCIEATEDFGNKHKNLTSKKIDEGCLKKAATKGLMKAFDLDLSSSDEEPQQVTKNKKSVKNVPDNGSDNGKKQALSLDKLDVQTIDLEGGMASKACQLLSVSLSKEALAFEKVMADFGKSEYSTKSKQQAFAKLLKEANAAEETAKKLFLKGDSVNEKAVRAALGKGIEAWRRVKAERAKVAQIVNMDAKTEFYS